MFEQTHKLHHAFPHGATNAFGFRAGNQALSPAIGAFPRGLGESNPLGNL